MTRAMARTHFPGSQLMRTLAELAVLKTHTPVGGFAHRLSPWISFTDAIALCAVHGAPVATAPATPTVAQATPASIADEFADMRRALETSIQASCALKANQARLRMPLPAPGASIQQAAAYGPYRRFHLAQQRGMELSVRALRARVRGQVAAAQPRLRQLVDLDAALDGVLCERETKVLATVASLLEKRFAHLFKGHQQTQLAAVQDDRPELWTQPGAWLGRFCHELETVLLAELDLRLQPTLGLIEASHHENLTFRLGAPNAPCP